MASNWNLSLTVSHCRCQNTLDFLLWLNSPIRTQAASFLKFIDHTRQVGFLWTSDQLVAKVVTYTTHSKHKILESMPSAGFEPVIRAFKRLQTTWPPDSARCVLLACVLSLSVCVCVCVCVTWPFSRGWPDLSTTRWTLCSGISFCCNFLNS